MGLTYIDGTVKGPSGEKRRVRFLVDSGAKYTQLPNDVWKALSLESKRAMDFILADGTPLKRQVSECQIALVDTELGEHEGHTPVILGEPGDVPLLGVITLEEFGLVLNPFSRTLQPMRMMLA